MDQHKAPDKTQMWKENIQEAEAGTGVPEHCPSSQRQGQKSQSSSEIESSEGHKSIKKSLFTYILNKWKTRKNVGALPNGNGDLVLKDTEKTRNTMLPLPQSLPVRQTSSNPRFPRSVGKPGAREAYPQRRRTRDRLKNRTAKWMENFMSCQVERVVSTVMKEVSFTFPFHQKPLVVYSLVWY